MKGAGKVSTGRESATFMVKILLPTLPRYLGQGRCVKSTEYIDRRGYGLEPDQNKLSYLTVCVKPKI